MKKALGHGTLIIMIMGVIGAIILIPGVTYWKDVLLDRSNIEMCRLSVVGKANTKLVGEETVPVSLECPRREITFHSNKVTLYEAGKEDTIAVMDAGQKKKRFSTLTDDIVKQVVAKEMEDCWYKMGEGKVNPFKQHIAIFGRDVCTLCATFRFDDKARDEGDKQVTGMNQYLAEKNTKRTKEKYTDYISKEQYGVVPEEIEASDFFVDVTLLEEPSPELMPPLKVSDSIDIYEDYALFYYVAGTSWLGEKRSDEAHGNLYFLFFAPTMYMGEPYTKCILYN